jgi:hypothetical protein
MSWPAALFLWNILSHWNAESLKCLEMFSSCKCSALTEMFNFLWNVQFSLKWNSFWEIRKRSFHFSELTVTVLDSIDCQDIYILIFPLGRPLYSSNNSTESTAHVFTVKTLWYPITNLLVGISPQFIWFDILVHTRLKTHDKTEELPQTLIPHTHTHANTQINTHTSHHTTPHLAWSNTHNWSVWLTNYTHFSSHKSTQQKTGLTVKCIQLLPYFQCR